MKKIISLMFVALLITSCGTPNNDEIDNNMDSNTEIEVNTWNDDVNVVIEDEEVNVDAWDLDVVIDGEEVNIDAWELNVVVDGEEVEVNLENEDQLIEEAINEIDNIINEIENEAK